MLSTYCTLIKTVFVLLLVAATYQLAITAPIVHRQNAEIDCDSSAHLRNGLFVTKEILKNSSNFSTVEQNFNTTNNTDTVAIERACDLLAYYYLVKELDRSNDLLFIILERTILDACNYWVNFNCTPDNLEEFGKRCRNARLLNVTEDADSKTRMAINGLAGHREGCPITNWVPHLKKSYNLTYEKCTTLTSPIIALHSINCSHGM